MNDSTNPTYRTVNVPTAFGPFPAQDLIEATATLSGRPLTSGLCRTVEEAQTRIRALLAGQPTRGSAPDYQASVAEMTRAAAFVEKNRPRDGGHCQQAIQAALAAGIHTVPWAIASRYVTEWKLYQ